MKKFIQLLAGVLIMTVITACSGEETEVAGYIEHVKINDNVLNLTAAMNLHQYTIVQYFRHMQIF